MSASKNLIQAAAGVGGGFYDYEIDYSARFNSGDSPVLTRTPSNTSSTQWTLSFWTKLSAVGTGLNFVNAGTADGNEDLIAIKGNGYLFYRYATSSNFHGDYSVFYRDPSAWYHIVLKWDSANATSTDRLAWYVNGNLAPMQSGDTVYPSLNQTTRLTNSSFTTVIGEHQRINEHLNAYLSQFAFVDGQALDPTEFAEYKNGVWVPKDITGLTYGTNGYLLDFSNSAALGTDVSGNGNNFTSSGLTSSDQMIDTPTNNFATLNPAGTRGASLSLSEGSLQLNNSGSGGPNGFSTIGLSSGKWYWEIRLTNYSTQQQSVGVVNALGASTNNVNLGTAINEWVLILQNNGNNGDLYNNGSFSPIGVTFAPGDTVGIALDVDSNSVWFRKNGTWIGSANPAAGTGAHFTSLFDPPYLPSATNINITGAVFDLNFGQNGTFNGTETAGGNSDENGYGDFLDSVPSGFLAICSANLPEPAIGPNSDTLSDEYFDTVTYTGNGAASRSITDLNFAPDFVWLKNRTDAYNHVLYDKIRGPSTSSVSHALSSSTKQAEGSFNDDTTYGFLSAFDSNGFTTQTGTADVYTNSTGKNYVAWNWKAGGSGSSNTDGSITATVSADTDSGFSIITYSGNSTSGATIGHGLTAAPEMVIVQTRSGTNNKDKPVYHVSVGATKAMILDTTNAEVTGVGFWNNTVPTSSVITLGNDQNTNQTGSSYVAYAFHSVESFSSFGKYTGNGSSDGSFVYTGFRPAWIMIKEISNADDWMVTDATINSYNPAYYQLKANTLGAEVGNTSSPKLDFVSNGVKLRASDGALNTSGSTYIYMAFAENPFKYSNAR